MSPGDGHDSSEHRAILRRIARQAMLERGLLPDFPPQAVAEAARLSPGDPLPGPGLRDLRHLPWCSIDNDDSRDLDQLSAGEELGGGAVRVLVAVADVDSLVRSGSALDGHARHNTCTVYTPAQVFPMLPERLSTDLTSLNPGEDRPAIVVETTVGPDGAALGGKVSRALVRNRAKLAYDPVGAWLEGRGGEPGGVKALPGLAENLRLQDAAARLLRSRRQQQGALGLVTIEARAVFSDGSVARLEEQKRNRARDLIEDFMIAANGVTARFLAAKGFPSLRRVVRVPKRWDRIRELAAEAGAALPENADPRALEAFLARERERDPLRFPDLSLSVIKLLGPGEYAMDPPGGSPPGHFGLAVRDYTHSTAPNRRFPDLITQRLLKAALEGAAVPYPEDQLAALARHCTGMEDAVKKVERKAEKSAAAILMEPRLGERFDAIVTGAADKGTWVRLLTLPVEGKLVRGQAGVDVGQRLRVQLVEADVEAGHIDFARA